MTDEIRREAKILINWMIDEGLSLKECEDVVRRAVIEYALYMAGHRISGAAIMLGYHRNTIAMEISRLGIKRIRAGAR